jgi:hypothetical protein
METDLISLVSGERLITNEVRRVAELARDRLGAGEDVVKRCLRNPSSEVQIFATAILLLQYSMNPVNRETSMDEIPHLQQCASIANTEHFAKPALVFYLDSVVSKFIRAASEFNEIKQLADIAKRVPILTIDGSQTDCSVTLAENKIKKLLWAERDSISDPLTGENIVNLLRNTLEFKEYLNALENFLKPLSRAILNFIAYRNNLIPNDFGYAANPSQDQEILNLLELLGIDLSSHAMAISLEEIQNSIKNAPRMPGPVRQNRVSLEQIIQELKELQITPITGDFTRTHRDPPKHNAKEDYDVIVQECSYNNQIATLKSIVVKKNYERVKQRAIQEIKYLQWTSSRRNNKANCFLQFFGAKIDEESFYLIMERKELDLSQYLARLKSENPGNSYATYISRLDKLAVVIYKMISSFVMLENEKLYHSDIKPANFITDDKWDIKLIDYGSMRMADETNRQAKVNEVRGTKHYMAPEVEAADRNDRKECQYLISRADVFSLGITILEIVTNVNIQGLNCREKHQQLMKIVNNLSLPWVKELLEKMLRLEPQNRPSFSELLFYSPGISTQSNPSVR